MTATNQTFLPTSTSNPRGFNLSSLYQPRKYTIRTSINRPQKLLETEETPSSIYKVNSIIASPTARPIARNTSFLPLMLTHSAAIRFHPVYMPLVYSLPPPLPAWGPWPFLPLQPPIPTLSMNSQNITIQPPLIIIPTDIPSLIFILIFLLFPPITDFARLLIAVTIM